MYPVYAVGEYNQTLEERIDKLESKLNKIVEFIEDAFEKQSWDMINDFLSEFGQNRDT